MSKAKQNFLTFIRQKTNSFLGSNKVLNVKVKQVYVIAFLTVLNSFVLMHPLQIEAQSYQPVAAAAASTTQPYASYLANSSAFKQEIARMEINVVRRGKSPLSITQVPRLAKDDILKVRLLDETVNGLKPDQSNYDWTFLVAFINPGRNSDAAKTVSEEIQFRRTGWYKEYSFNVPYDSQPVFFLYPKPNYRAKILNLINNNPEDIRKIGEKTLELAGAYAKIGSFISELQSVVNSTSYGAYGTSGAYSTSGAYNPYGSYAGYNGTGNLYGNSGSSTGFNKNQFMNLAVERLVRSFNIQLPSCWQGAGANYGGSPYGVSSAYGSPTYNPNNSNLYGSSYPSTGAYGSVNPYGITNDFVGRVQCLAKSVRLEDFDISVSQLLQQGGILAAAQLSQRYPQIAQWINLAAVAIDIILKIVKKSPLKIVPTVISSSLIQKQTAEFQTTVSYQANFNGISSPSTSNTPPNDSVKISLFAESQPSDNGFVTAYPVVVQKWQAEPDPEVLALPAPALMEPCLHVGQNILRNTDLLNDWMADNFTKDFQLTVNLPGGAQKQFPLKKNVGMVGWELSLTQEELNSIPRSNNSLESEISGKRGFNVIKSPKFALPIPASGTWVVDYQSIKDPKDGAKKTIRLKNQAGGCRCVQSVIYKPATGGQYLFEADNGQNNLVYSDDEKEITIKVDTANFTENDGQIEIKQYSGEVVNLNLNLVAQPVLTNVKISKGDNYGIINGLRLNQVRAVIVDGKRARLDASKPTQPETSRDANQSINSSENLSSDELKFVFEDPTVRQMSNNFWIELELADKKLYKYPQIFEVATARPTIVTNPTKEIGVGLTPYNRPQEQSNSLFINDTMAFSSENKSNENKSNGSVSKVSQTNIPEKTSNAALTNSTKNKTVQQATVNIQNALTDYDFKAENISVETRIDNNQAISDQLPAPNVEVLDWKHIRVDFQLNDQFRSFLGERKLQFRIRDKYRGDSDWYTLRNDSENISEESLKFTAKVIEKCASKDNGAEKGKTTLEEKINVLCPQISTAIDISSQTQTINTKSNTVNLQTQKSDESNESQVQKGILTGNTPIAQGYNATALDYFLKGFYSEAFDYFNRAVISDPQVAMYHYNLASALTALRQFDKAEKEMMEAVRLDPVNTTYKVGLEAAKQNIKNFSQKRIF